MWARTDLRVVMEIQRSRSWNPVLPSPSCCTNPHGRHRMSPVFHEETQERRSLIMTNAKKSSMFLGMCLTLAGAWVYTASSQTANAPQPAPSANDQMIANNAEE